MAALFSAQITRGDPARDPDFGPVLSKTGTFTVSSFADGDTIDMIRVPPFATVLDVVTIATDIDSNGTPEILLDIGDDDTANLFNNDSTIGQTGGIARATAGIPKTYGVDGGIIRITVPTDAATDAAGTITTIIYYQDNRDRRTRST